jgi:hypothetical protein
MNWAWAIPCVLTLIALCVIAEDMRSARVGRMLSVWCWIIAALVALVWLCFFAGRWSVRSQSFHVAGPASGHTTLAPLGDARPVDRAARGNLFAATAHQPPAGVEETTGVSYRESDAAFDHEAKAAGRRTLFYPPMRMHAANASSVTARIVKHTTPAMAVSAGDNSNARG